MEKSGLLPMGVTCGVGVYGIQKFRLNCYFNNRNLTFLIEQIRQNHHYFLLYKDIKITSSLFFLKYLYLKAVYIFFQLLEFDGQYFDSTPFNTLKKLLSPGKCDLVLGIIFKPWHGKNILDS